MYCSLADIEKVETQKTLIDLTFDYDETTEPKIITEKVDAAISQASNEIDAYCAIRYIMPLNSEVTPDFIKDICVEISIYKLYKRRQRLNMPDSLISSYKSIISQLRDVAAGKMIVPGLSEITKETISTSIITNKTAIDKTYTKAYLDTF